MTRRRHGIASAHLGMQLSGRSDRFAALDSTRRSQQPTTDCGVLVAFTQFGETNKGELQWRASSKSSRTRRVSSGST